MEEIRRQLELELVRAESVVASDNGEYKTHQPTIDNHRGQVLALRKALHLLEMAEVHQQGPITLNKVYTFPWPTLTIVFLIVLSITLM